MVLNLTVVFVQYEIACKFVIQTNNFNVVGLELLHGVLSEFKEGRAWENKSSIAESHTKKIFAKLDKELLSSCL